MYGKHFESMYEGSMYGAGLGVFAVWGYVISHSRKGRVELNPVKLADTLGGTVEEIEKAIKVLRSPDPRSRNKLHEGKRLVKEGEYQYFIPSWETYHEMKNADDRREYNRIKQREYRERKRHTPLAGETSTVKAAEDGHLDPKTFEPKPLTERPTEPITQWDQREQEENQEQVTAQYPEPEEPPQPPPAYVRPFQPKTPPPGTIPEI
jgi:hypothetical protein